MVTSEVRSKAGGDLPAPGRATALVGVEAMADNNKRSVDASEHS